MIETLIKCLDMPESCLVDKKIFKKMFYENYKFNSNDKKIFKDNILNVTWLYSVKPDNSNILEFVDESTEYKEVTIISVETTAMTDAKLLRATEIIHRSIPYATFLFMYDSNDFVLSSSSKRISNLSKEEIVTDEVINTAKISVDSIEDTLESFAFKNQDMSNLKAFYESILSRTVTIISLQKIGSSSEKVTDPIEQNRILHQITEYEKKIASLKRDIEKETQFNKKVEANISIKNIETQIIELKKIIS